MRELVMKTFQPFIRGNALELGCEVGYLSSLIAPHVTHLDIVDGSALFLEKAKERNISNATYIHSLFEDFKPEPESYDTVFATFVLEHLIDARPVLDMVRRALKPGGLLLAVVPNAHVISRQLALHMGLLDSLYDLTPNDVSGGHRRVYDRVLFDRELRDAGFVTVSQGGIFFKPFADFQMSQLIDDKFIRAEHIEGMYRLGNQYPDLCSAIYSIVRANNDF
jgi:SAM-dependent methyltransferase